MDNSRFSSLVYRIIGTPERWHDDYIDIMHQVLDETDSIDDPANFSELAVGEQILSRLSGTNEALTAFGTLLDRSRFKMIILDNKYFPIYFNENAEGLYNQLLSKVDQNALNADLIKKAKLAAAQNKSNAASGNLDNICALDYVNQDGGEIYLRSIHNHTTPDVEPATYYLLLVLDKDRNENHLNPDLIARYELTDKEQNVLKKLVHGDTIKEIASASFVSENTVKTHLKALFRKTDTKSQTDIVRLVLTHESQVLDSYFGTGGGRLPINNGPSKDKFVQLASGAKVAYRQYGPETGDIVIVCHNGYGCRITIPHEHEAILTRLNKQAIILDRPGYGKTPYIEGHPENWNTILKEFIDALEIDSFELLGSVLGSTMALHYATSGDPRLSKVTLASPIFVNADEERAYLAGILAPTTRLVKASKRFAREVYELWLKSIKLNLATQYRGMVKDSLGTKERPLLDNAKTLDLMVEGLQEGSSQSLEGISKEMVFCISPRQVDLSKVTIPVHLWWGSQDTRFTQEGIENLAQQLPNSHVFIREGYSEHIYYALFEEILST